VDFGGANTALLWLAEEPGTGRLFVWEESLSGGKSTRQHVAEALEKAAGRNLVAAWGGAPGEEQQRWDWAAEGLEVLRPPVGDVEAGINRVTELLKAKRVKISKPARACAMRSAATAASWTSRGSRPRRSRTSASITGSMPFGMWRRAGERAGPRAAGGGARADEEDELRRTIEWPPLGTGGLKAG
jgi:hypothetical protein